MDKIVIAMKIDDIKRMFEEDDSLKYALATNLAKYGRPQSKKSDKPAKLTKSLEKGREKYVKDLKKSMSELDDSGLSKGYIMARDIIAMLREKVYPKLNDDELEEFGTTMHDHFMDYMKESINEDKADAVRWFGNLKYYYNKAFAELKGEDRETYKQLAKDFFSKLEIDQYIRPVGLDEDEGTLNKIADMLDRKFPDLRFDVNTMSDRIDVRGSQQDLFNFGTELHGEKIFDYEVFHIDDDDRGEIVRIVKSDSIMRGEAYSGFIRSTPDPDSEPFEPTGSVSQFQEDLRALFGKFKGDLKNPEFIKGVAQIMANWKSLLRSQLDEEYKVAGRTVKLNKGKNPDGTDWTVTFPNGKTTSLADVLALIDPKPEVTKEEKDKADRCLRIARRKIPQSSAYRSGLIVKCRKGMIWKSEK